MLSALIKSVCISLYPDESGRLVDDCENFVEKDGERCERCWEALATADDMRIRVGVATDPNLPSKWLVELSEDPVGPVAQAIARRDLSVEQTLAMTHHSNERVSHELARHTPHAQAQAQMFRDRVDDTIIGHLLKNPALDRHLTVQIKDLGIPRYSDPAAARLQVIQDLPQIAGVG